MVKHILKEALAFSLLKSQQMDWENLEEITSLFFHDPSPKQFEIILKWISRTGLKPISIQELGRQVKEEKVIPGQVFISFDDGWKGNLELIPLVEKYQVPIAIFISTEPVLSGNYWWEFAGQKAQQDLTGISSIENFKHLSSFEFQEKIKTLKNHYNLERSSMTVDQLQELDKHELVTLGAHTVTHPILKQCTPDQQSFELAASKKTLEAWLGRPVNHLAYPNGDYNEHTLALAKKLGYELSFTTQPARIDVTKVDHFTIPRYCIEDDHGRFESLSKASGAWWSFRSILKAKPKAAAI